MAALSNGNTIHALDDTLLSKSKKSNGSDTSETAKTFPSNATKKFLAIKDGYIDGFRLTPPYHLAWGRNKLTLKSSEGPSQKATRTDKIFMSSEAANLKYMEFDETSDQVFILSRYSRRRNSDLQRFATTDLREIFPVTPGASRDKVTIAVNLGKPFRGQYEEFMVWMKRLVDKKSVMRVGGMAVESVWKTIQTRNAERIKGVDLAVIRNEEDESDDELGGWNDHLSVDKILKPPAQESGQLSSVVYLEPDARLSVSQTSCVIGAQSHNNSEAISKLRPPPNSTGESEFGDQIASDPDSKTILVYPSGQTGAISITKGDLIRLQPNGLLNDTLIEFSLKLGSGCTGLSRMMSKLAKEIHIFSSFFYKKLEQRELQESYASVAKWTAKFDLFKKKYLIVPINENLHWYLAIIYHPECVLRPEPPYIKASPSSYSESRMRRPDSSLKATTISEKSTFEDINIGSHWQPLSLLDDLDVDEPMEVDFSTEHVGNQQSTYIFTLDSLGSSHSRVGSLLGNYLRQEALAKKNIPETGLSQAVYKHALVPQQPNSCDCGLYLLHFVQTFFEDPDKYANIIRTRTSAYPEADRRADWKVKGIADMRETLRSKIKDLSIKWKRESVVNELKKQWDSAAVSYSSENDSDVMGTASVEPHGAAPHFHTTQ
ncbi:ULP-PROTEASE domain-containing protein [Mycena indigotica]|uniref:ULP-PROTEASE domain-containing protein n=1 Tax=Mycena indigotica TaxID=2126181 RepID=A0A8H6T4Z4_9AGAR|nr:ULP-PROTEASE domain-containing protein [Mycena indigotica]KAF7311848.1 ULP-PROTEASE domain-containing protein [Mycena indigotica]